MKNHIIAIWVVAVITISANLCQGQVVDVLPTVETMWFSSDHI